MKKTYISLAVVIVIILSTIIGAFGFYNLKASENKIFENVFIDGINVGGLSKEEAIKEINENKFFGDLTLTYGSKKHEYSLEVLGCDVKTEAAVEEAYNIGRDQSLLNNLTTFYKHRYFEDTSNIELEYYIPDDIRSQIISDLEPMYNKEPKNAEIYIDSKINITSESKGAKLDGATLDSRLEKGLIPNQNITIEIPVETVEPEITYNKLSQINGVIGSYKTNFSESQAGRNENIRLSASRISDTILMPGEEFSYNSQTGLKTEKNGYKLATVIVNGEIEEGIGGGVCQVSSTLYNSVLYAGLDVSQRRPHSIPSSYVEYGRDAVVSDNAIDFKFINNYDFPVYIKTYTDKNSVSVKIYGNTSKVEKIDIYSKVISKKEKTVKYVDDPTLPKGQEKIKDKGRDEVISETFKVVNGVETRISRDKYPMKPKIILVGTKEN